MKHEHVWNQIPLEDYEKHMAHDQVGQLQLLSGLTKKYVGLLNPKKPLFLGIAGGNGLEHIDPVTVEKVVGVDINADYLLATERRFGKHLQNLELHHLDITTENRQSIVMADWAWAALVLEYTGIEKSLDFIDRNLQAGGDAIITIQENNGVQSVSPTGVDSVKAAGSLFQLIAEEKLLPSARDKQFALVSKEENFLPNGKSFRTYHFRKESR